VWCFFIFCDGAPNSTCLFYPRLHHWNQPTRKNDILFRERINGLNAELSLPHRFRGQLGNPTAVSASTGNTHVSNSYFKLTLFSGCFFASAAASLCVPQKMN
jgi:hypothetical protein